jgi:hypothetical protein
VRWLARVVFLAAAISIAAAVVPNAVGADQSSCQPGSGPPNFDPSTAGGVNIHVTRNNSVTWCSASLLEANKDVTDTNYPLRSTAQSPSDNPVSNAISVSGLLMVAGVNPADVNHLEIARLSGIWSMLTNADLVNPSAFQGGLKPIFWINGFQTEYTRPLRSPSDTNGNDQILASAGNALDVYIYSGPVLAVTANATPSHAAKNQSVTLTARATNATSLDGSLRYTWTFQDGSTAMGQAVTHGYATAGIWYPVVTVQGQNDSGGVSQPIPVTVGSVPKSGSTSKSGGTNPRKDAHLGGPTHSHGTTGNTSPTNKNSGSSATTTSSTTTPTTTTSTTTTTSATTTSHQPGANAHHAATTRPPASSHQQVQPQPSPGGTVVDGRLIADVVPISAVQLAQQSSQQPVQAHAPSARAGGGSITPLGGIAGGCAIVVLLGSGAGVELRSRRRAVTPVRTA